MKLFAPAVLVGALSLAATRTASAFHVRAVRPQPFSTSTSLGMSSFHLVSDVSEMGEFRNEGILNALGTMEGPSICYGHFAALENKRELDIKEYDNFEFFKAAIDQAECTKILLGNGPFTVFAPTNSAIEKYQGVLTDEIIKHHIVPKDIYTDEMQGTFETLSGHTITFRNEFRKTYVDNALIGQLDNHTGGTPYPTNIVCENGVIHAINVVLEPGYTRSAADSQGVQGLALQSHLNQNVLKDRNALPEDANEKH
uniref:FAS1 domain-containing protein n=1 Tax=Trieres chinensis TaxID=1514140 RepID=A0A7S2ABJ0_TRICV|mmetsp:Transcript_9210/g.19534  ORF Transcript_9210/g.19534 Transcript_9210/m.19534 type:complete len:255 (+) Transcript_9210:83-847(+)|eukprot:CAMPEP_0183306484 /NCGR_PEP_ID=MMETSP0160_2-20130417/11719_1 /TAXON_ID=2839 ORGANISM="Odontella Sinensis, Strain Grunow 1884" /NCGR_SAMPLE_ID=MMETSP0160_2 /ASSEMBLY_ACC=CAM_ASM_000250 /LENGTH=254 /DNA_ID=CAMNT_0025469865 /DNA_START=51 /DNA_END=815 /DNA_ORIENTATION=+